MKTAVEFLVSKLFDSEVPLDEHIYNAIEQAKEMEKEQHKKTYFKGWHSIGNRDEDFEQYYNETFKQQEQ
jgi:hypothetical protein